MFGVLMNVGSNSSNPNGRGRIFADYSFEFMPIPEMSQTSQNVPTYRELGFAHVKLPDLQVHLDPEFKSLTYGHVKRGFGDIGNLMRLKRDDYLFFYATLEKESGWSPYIIGYFQNLEVHDCRNFSSREVFSFKSKGFENCAHLKRAEPHVDLLIKGGQGSKKLMKAFPLAEEGNHLTLVRRLEDLILTSTGKKIESGKPWFRWTLTCNSSVRLLEMIDTWQTV
jgi:hypothetical protein